MKITLNPYLANKRLFNSRKKKTFNRKFTKTFKLKVVYFTYRSVHVLLRCVKNKEGVFGRNMCRYYTCKQLFVIIMYYFKKLFTWL